MGVVRIFWVLKRTPGYPTPERSGGYYESETNREAVAAALWKEAEAQSAPRRGGGEDGVELSVRYQWGPA